VGGKRDKKKDQRRVRKMIGQRTYNDDGGQDDGQFCVLPPHGPLAFLKDKEKKK
jgi:hypothetical protein